MAQRITECSRIADQLRRCYEGGAWPGPALLELLEDVDAHIASRRPIANAHTIWELVLHISGWERVVLHRIGGKESTLEGEGNFSTPADTSDNAWKQAIAELKQTHQELLSGVSQMTDSGLSEPVPGKDHDLYFMLHGAAQHALYHAGQIALLKKA